MKHFLSLLDLSDKEISRLLSRAWALKNGAPGKNFTNRIMACLFFNPSLRTRLSFEAAMVRLGGRAISFSPGAESWGLEFESGAVMDQGKPEHVKDAARVISRMAQVIGVRSFAKLHSLAEDAAEQVLNSFAAYSTVPVVNMESAMEHPCQGLSDMLTIQERLGKPAGKNFVLTWAPHIKPLPMAVSHSAMIAAARLGMNVTVAHPEGYDLHPSYLAQARQYCSKAGSSFQVANKISLTDADVVYAKSWGSPLLYGNPEEQTRDFDYYSSWKFEADQLPAKSIFMHCLPVRRNVEVSDSVLDSAQSAIIDQAENRLWAQSAILELLLASRSNVRRNLETLAA